MAEQEEPCGNPSAKPYILETDVSSNCPVHYLSVVTKYFLPVDLVNDTSVQKIIDSGMFDGFARVQEDTGAKTTEIVTGSSAEGLVIPDYLDTSTNLLQVSPDLDKVTVIYNEFVRDDSQPPGQQELQVKYQTEDATSGPVNYANIRYTEDYELVRKSCCQQHLTLCDIITEASVHKGKRSHDPVAISFKSWPRAAIPWMVRSRPSGWPSPEVKVAVVQGGYHMIPVVEKNNADGLLWEYAFYNAEKQLAHSLSRDQRQAFVLFELIRLYYLDMPDILSHEHLRTVLFWMLEKVPCYQFHENNIGKMLLQLLNELAVALATRTLKHYFISDVNLLDGISSDHCKSLWKKIKWVCDNAIQVILQLNQRLQFSGLGFKLDMESCFSEHTSALKNNPKDELVFYNALIAGCFKMIEVHLTHLGKLYNGKQNNEQKAQVNVLINVCMQALWDIQCYSAETEDFPSDLHSAIYSLGYFNDAAPVVARVVLHICSKAGLSKDKAADCTDDIIHYCKVNQNGQRAANLLEAKLVVMETEAPQSEETDNSKLYVKHSIKQC